MTRDDLIHAVWGDVCVTDDSLTQCISEIRRVLNDPERTLVRTVTKRGFLLDLQLPEIGSERQEERSNFAVAIFEPDPFRATELFSKISIASQDLNLIREGQQTVVLEGPDLDVLLDIATDANQARLGVALTSEMADVASKLAHIAGSGQIFSTIGAWDVGNLGPNFDLEDHGELDMPVEGMTVRVVRIIRRRQRSMLGYAAHKPDPRPTITILPPVARLEQPFGEVLGSIIADDLAATITASPEVNVTSRLSTANWRGNNGTLSNLSDLFGSDFVLSGHFFQVGEETKLSLEFAETRSDKVLWIETRTCPTQDILHGQSALDEIAAKVQNAVIRNEVRKLQFQPLETLENFTLLFSAIGLMHRLSVSDFFRARTLLSALNDRLSDQPVVLAWLSRWFILRVHQGWSDDPQKDAQSALDCTRRALDIEPENTLALSSEGHVLTNLFKRFDLAENRFEAALSVNPNDAISHLLRGTFYAFQGRGEQAERDASRALQLSPYDPHRFFYLAHAAGASLAADNNEHALELTEQSLRYNRSHAPTLRVKTVAQVRLGDVQSARETASELLRVQPTLRTNEWLANSPSGQFDIGTSFARDMQLAGIPK
ncbi:hypothetical protein GCM10007385_24850 [Tateyamaria omphalii]|nr:hypothetical protein GCM10007385_24850 [Tateyamaria omphalii]